MYVGSTWREMLLMVPGIVFKINCAKIGTSPLMWRN